MQIQVHPAGGEELPAGALRLRVYFVESYPSDCAPVAELKAPWITEDSSRKILTEFGEIYRHGGRDVVVFKWVDWLQVRSYVLLDNFIVLGASSNAPLVSLRMAVNRDSVGFGRTPRVGETEMDVVSSPRKVLLSLHLHNRVSCSGHM